MAHYQSHYLPRRQTTMLGKIQSVERYERFYDLARDALAAGTLQHLVLPAGRLLVRASKAAYDAEASRTVPPGSAMNSGNRFSGARPHGAPGQGALYLGTIAGVLREHAHYAKLPPQTSRLQPVSGHGPLLHTGAADVTRKFIEDQKAGASARGQVFHLYELTQLLRFADFRTTVLAPMFLQLLRTGAATKRYGVAAHVPLDLFVTATSEPHDYSAARGMADAVADCAAKTGDAGVCAFSARGDRDDGLVLESHGDPTGGLVFALFGRDGRVAQALRPAGPGAGYATVADLLAALA